MGRSSSCFRSVLWLAVSGMLDRASWCMQNDSNRYHILNVQDKILQSMGRGQHATVTNDGATILKSVYVDNPAAKVLVGTLADFDTQNNYVGDLVAAEVPRPSCPVFCLNWLLVGAQ